jgi:hypothetical protein
MEHTVDDSISVCTRVAESLLSRQETNAYLEQGGVLVRAVNAHDEPANHTENGQPVHYKYAPASYLHVSLRPSRICQERSTYDSSNVNLIMCILLVESC